MPNWFVESSYILDLWLLCSAGAQIVPADALCSDFSPVYFSGQCWLHTDNACSGWKGEIERLFSPQNIQLWRCLVFTDLILCCWGFWWHCFSQSVHSRLLLSMQPVNLVLYFLGFIWLFPLHRVSLKAPPCTEQEFPWVQRWYTLLGSTHSGKPPLHSSQAAHPGCGYTADLCPIGTHSGLG